MTRVTVSTTVDGDLLQSARDLRSGLTDAALLDEALEALRAQHRSAEVDASGMQLVRYSRARLATDSRSIVTNELRP
jgi:hypothetical protein